MARHVKARLEWLHMKQEAVGRTISKEGACILDMCNIVGVAEATVAAKLLCWIGAAFLDGLSPFPPVCLVCFPGRCFDLASTLRIMLCFMLCYK